MYFFSFMLYDTRHCIQVWGSNKPFKSHHKIQRPCLLRCTFISPAEIFTASEKNVSNNSSLNSVIPIGIYRFNELFAIIVAISSDCTIKLSAISPQPYQILPQKPSYWLWCRWWYIVGGRKKWAQGLKLNATMNQ